MKYEFYEKKDNNGFWSWLCNLKKPYTALYCSDVGNENIEWILKANTIYKYYIDNKLNITFVSKGSDRLFLCGDRHKLFKEVKP